MMMPGKTPVQENPLGLSWHDSAWIPVLNPSNIMDYFSERSNPFYDRTCNNEIVKMQRLSPDQLNNMTGLEYILLHVQEPILYVIRKQLRHSPTQASAVADYYIIAGVVYQAPDLGSVVSSRLFTTYNLLSMRQAAVLDITPVKAILGISKMVRLWLQRRKRQCARNLARCFNAREWICYLQNLLVNFLYQCQSQYIKQVNLL
ncbi:PREDICTED: mediator of RNA polymerase II transcription subunit 6 isoform X2 [Atta colombica]|uniref:mediator of RNA polymerase II transcription subunit 6 isoform X2 n=1 Tax=Atta colombica TaxID=520822 RepID=UPI00084CA2CA|nr:PREDICTED: mediator of RNA polymerase II transcription subunit 6 isoform X2 [Atta colombica]